MGMLEKNIRCFVLCMITIIAGASLTEAATVQLKNGRSIAGDVREKNGVVTIVTEDNQIYQFNKDDIKTITEGSDSVLADKASEPAKGEEKKEMSKDNNPIIKISTSLGDMKAMLYEDKTPNTVANIINLAENNFYKDMKFHRIITGFMAQGGCPNSREGASGVAGTGGPGYRIADEFDSSLRHTKRGLLSMANSGPNTNGSQFFITFKETPWLDNKHGIFGEIIEGFEVLDKLEAAGSQSGRPTKDIEFSISVISKQDHPYEVKKL